MAFSKVLYFIALVPPPVVNKEVLKIKNEIKEKFGVKHALKLPAHITLIPPVWLQNLEEKPFLESVKQVAEDHAGFPVELENFGHFSNRVFFIDVVNPEYIKELHQVLSKSLTGFLPKDQIKSIHPHVTVATRDLSKEVFEKAWPDFENRSYSSQFEAKAVTVFRHNGKAWDVLKEFPFSKRSGKNAIFDR